MVILDSLHHSLIVGFSGFQINVAVDQSWILAWDFCSGITEELMKLNWHKINEYKQGLKALNAIS